MKIFEYLSGILALVLTGITTTAIAVPPIPEHAAGHFKIVCKNARLRLDALPLAISFGQCYNEGYRTDITMFANGQELASYDYGVGNWPLTQGQIDRTLDLELRVEESDVPNGPHIWVMLTDYYNNADYVSNNGRLWVDLYSYSIYPRGIPTVPSNITIPAPTFAFNEMLSDYSTNIVSGEQLTQPLTWGVLGYDRWYRGEGVTPTYNFYNHAWAYHTNIPYRDQTGSFDLASLYSANTKIKTSVTNLRQQHTHSITGFEAPWDHLGDVVFEVYDDTLPSPIGDFNGSATCDTGDLFGFINCYFAGSLAADIDNDLDTDTGDFFQFLDCWFAGRH